MDGEKKKKKNTIRAVVEILIEFSLKCRRNDAEIERKLDWMVRSFLIYNQVLTWDELQRSWQSEEERRSAVEVRNATKKVNNEKINWKISCSWLEGGWNFRSTSRRNSIQRFTWGKSRENFMVFKK